MPRYHFHLHECSVVTRDEAGRDVRSLDAARDLAIREARIIMCEEMKEGRLCLDCHIEIAGSGGECLTIVQFRDAVTVRGAVPGGPACH